MTSEELTNAYEEHMKLVWNLCCTFLHNLQDVEDAVQDTFLKLAGSGRVFPDREALRAWLIVTAKNVCRDELRRALRRELPLEEADGRSAELPEPDETLAALRSLPEKYKAPLYLFYYEGLPAGQISALLGRKESTVRSDLRRGRLLLKKLLERSTL